MEWTEIENRDRSWDDLVNSSMNGTFFHTQKWIDILEESLNIKIKCYLLKDGQDPVGLIPFLLSSQFGLPMMLPIPISDYNNLVIKDHRGDANEIFRSLKDLSKDLGSFMSIVPLPNNLPYSSNVKGLYEYEGTGNMILNLESNPPDRIWNDIFNSKIGQINHIRKMEKNGFQLKQIGNKEDLTHFYKYYRSNLEYIGVTPLGYKHFETIFDKCDTAELKGWILSDGDQIAGGLISFLYNPTKTMYIKYLSLNRELLKPYTPTYTLFWNAIDQAHDLGCKMICFGSTTRDPKLGHYKMKERMGCHYERKSLCYIPRNFLAGNSLRIFKYINRSLIGKSINKRFDTNGMIDRGIWKDPSCIQEKG